MTNRSEQETCSTITEEIGYLLVTPTICLYGIVFNTIILIIFSKSSFRAQMTPSLVMYPIGLTIADLMNSLITLPLGFIRYVPTSNPSIQCGYNLYEKYIDLWLSLGHITITISIWITLVLTIELFVYLFNTGGDVTGQSTRRSVHSTRCILAGIIITATCFCSPLFFYYDDVSGDESLQRSEFAKSTGYDVYS